MPHTISWDEPFKQLHILIQTSSNAQVILATYGQELNLKSSIFWNIMLCNPLKVNQHFGGHTASTFMGEGKTKQEISMKQAASIDSLSACC
jgi:hypothetical protein